MHAGHEARVSDRQHDAVGIAGRCEVVGREHLVRPESAGELPAALVRLDHADGGSGVHGDGRELQAHLPRAEHDHAVAAHHPALVEDGVHAVGERLDEDRAIGRQIVGHGERPVRPGVATGREQGEVGVAGVRVAVDAVAHVPAGNGAARRLDAPDPLVARVQRVAVGRTDQELAQVGRAEPARLDPDEQIAGAGLGIGQRLDAQVADAVQAGGAHVRHHPSATARRPARARCGRPGRRPRPGCRDPPV